MNKRSASLIALLAVSLIISMAGNAYCVIGDYVYCYPYAWDKKPGEVATILELWGTLNIYKLKPVMTKFEITATMTIQKARRDEPELYIGEKLNLNTVKKILN